MNPKKLVSLLFALLFLSFGYKQSRAEFFKTQILQPLDNNGLYVKSSMGFMPPAYGPDDTERAQLLSRASANSGLFTPYLVYPTGSWPEGAVAGAWTGDSLLDAALTTSFNFDPVIDNKAHVFGQGVGGSLSLTQSVLAGDLSIFITKGDFNYDGLDDVAVVNQNDDAVGVFLQNPGGGLGTMAAYPVGANPDGITTGDFNGDLRDDLAVTHSLSQTVTLYYQQLDGTLGAPANFGLSSGGFNDVDAGDLNGDGYADLVVLRGAGHQSSQVAVFYQQNHTFGAPVFFTAEDGGFLTHGLAVGDVTGDGREDIVVTAGGNTPNAFLNVFVQQTGGPIAASPVVYTDFHLPEAVEIGDVNHDGRNDIVAVHASWLTLSVYLQTPAGTLSPYEMYNLPYRDFYRADSLALGDVTGDGALDVLIANASSLPTENGLVVLENTGTAPTSAITTPATGAYITGSQYIFQGTTSAGATLLEISTDGGLTWVSQAATANWSYNWTVPGTDGYYVILTRARNAAGQVQSPPAETHVIMDHTVPIGSLLINNDAQYTNALLVTLNVTASDFNGVEGMRFNNDGGAYSTWTGFATTYPWTLSGADGVKTVNGQVRDYPGNLSTAFSDTIILDTTPPTCGIQINSNAAYANTSQVTLTLSSTDINGVASMRTRNAAGTWSSWVPYDTSLGWNLTGGDGSKTVEAEFQDVAGNISSTCSDTIILDTTPPTCSIQINGGALFTNQTAITLGLNSSDTNGVTLMRFSDNGTSWGSWQTYATSANWNLPGPDGLLPVYAQFQDAATNVSSSCQDSITLDTTAPTGFLIINGGALYTSNPSVTLTLGASDLNVVVQMRFSDDGVNWSTLETYATTKSWNLPGADGVKTVYVEYLDQAGNVGGPFTDTIIFDTTAPTGGVVINADATYTNDPNVVLTITATDSIPVTEMRVSHDGTIWGVWEPYATSKNWALQTGDGTKTVYVQFKDAIGNTSVAFADVIILDTTAPTCQVFINTNAIYSLQVAVTLNLSCSDANPPLEMQISNDGTTWTPWEAYSAVRSWTLSSGDGTKTVYINARDVAGNVGGPYTDTIILDTTAPTCTPTINTDATYTNSPSVTLAPGCTDTNTVTQMRVSDDGINWGSWQTYQASLPWVLPVGDGEKTIYVQAKDTPGNESISFTDTIILDTTLPSGGCLLPDYINANPYNVQPWASDDNGVPFMRIRNAGDPWGDWLSFAPIYLWTFPGGDGQKTIECQFKDSAENLSPLYFESTILDTVAPTCNLTVNGGAEFVNDVQVTLTSFYSDTNGLNEMRFSNNASTWSGWIPPSNSYGWSLNTGEGPHTVYGQYRDVASNVQQCSDEIILDTVNPTGTMMLADDALYATAITITVQISATDATSGVASVCLSDTGLPCDLWMPYSQELTWVLAFVEGEPQEVCAWFKDNAENTSSAACDSIILDSEAPSGAIKINEDAVYTNQITTTLTLSATDQASGVGDYRLSADGSTWESWETYSSSAFWLLSGADGEKTVFVQYRDAAGNVSSSAFDSIVLDREVPIGSVLINDGAVSTDQLTVTLTVDAQDLTSGVCEMQIRNAGDDWGEWQTFETTVSWELFAGENPEKVVEVQFRDCAGNVSEAVSDAILVETGFALYIPFVTRP